MIGAIIGDIVGSRWEFNPTNDYNFEWLSDENDFTDDTICTIAIADALLKDRDYEESLLEWCRKYPHPKGGYGGRFGQWVRSYNPQPYYSFGNGSAMRVGPIGWWFDNREDILEEAKMSAVCTHNHREGIKGAQTVALAIFKALSYRFQEAPMHIDEILSECVEFSGYDINMPKSSVKNKFDETCQGTVPVALKIISMSTCFEDAVRLAVSLGADADTLGAIVGGIAEAIWGIPSKMRRRFEDFLPEDLRSVVRQFRYERRRAIIQHTDTCYAGDDFSDVSWDMLYDMDGKEVYDETMLKTIADHENKRKLMAERGKARENW